MQFDIPVGGMTNMLASEPVHKGWSTFAHKMLIFIMMEAFDRVANMLTNIFAYFLFRYLSRDICS